MTDVFLPKKVPKKNNMDFQGENLQAQKFWNMLTKKWRCWSPTSFVTSICGEAREPSRPENKEPSKNGESLADMADTVTWG